MKRSSALFLLCSLLANGVFATLLLLRSPPVAEPKDRLNPVVASAPALAPSLNLPIAASDLKPMALDPTAPGTIDFAGLPAKLQAAGLSSEIARFATTAAVKQHYSERRLALGLRPDPANFTRNPVTSGPGTAEERAMKKLIDDEEREQLDALFGTEPEFSLDTQRRHYDGLPESKAVQLRKILADYRAMQARLNGENNSPSNSPEVRTKTELIRKEMRVDIEQLLSRDELLTYDLRNSSAAGLLRNRLGAFQATEEEFRALYPVFKAAEDAGVRHGLPNLDAEMRAVLGDLRFSEVQEANAQAARQSQAFIEARSFVVSRNLAPAVANELLIIQAEFQPRVAVLEQARVATPDQREAQLATLRQEAKARLVRLFGPDGADAYVAAKGGWLDSPRPRIP